MIIVWFWVVIGLVDILLIVYIVTTVAGWYNEPVHVAPRRARRHNRKGR